MRSHVSMTEVIVREVYLFIQRHGTKSSHRYYATAYLNRVAAMVAPKDEKVRIMLFKIYFAQFKTLLQKAEDDKKKRQFNKKGGKGKKDRAKSKDE